MLLAKSVLNNGWNFFTMGFVESGRRAGTSWNRGRSATRANLAVQLNVALPARTLDEMVRARAGEYSGDALYKAVLADARAELGGVRQIQGITDGEAYCFAAGTLVHTRDGLKPIEAIRTGDWVLSQPEATGERAYKQVTRTVRHEDKPVCLVRFFAKRNGEAVAQELLVTPNHPFYVAGYHNGGQFSDEYWDEMAKPIGWRRADLLESHQLVQLANGETMRVSTVDRLWQSRTPGEAWIEDNPDSTSGRRVRISGAQAQRGEPADADLAGSDDFNERNASLESQVKWAHTCTVYNFEVEDFHTYYVGEQGVWVHNTNCFEIH